MPTITKKTIKEKGIENAKFVAKIALGRTILSNVNGVLRKKAPIMVRGYFDEYSTVIDVAMAFAIARLAENYRPDDKKLAIVAESLELAALSSGGEVLGKMLCDLLDKVSIPEILTEDVADAEVTAVDSK